MDISKLNVLLTGGIAGFSAAMASGKKDLDGFTGSFRSSAGVIAGIGATLGAGAAVAGFVELTKSAFENIAATKRFAETIGMSTLALSQLDASARVTGVSTEALHSALFKMSKVLGGADEEGGKAAEAFTALGLKVEDLAAIPADQALHKIADALNKVENANDRNADAVKIFGKGVSDILPLLSQGSAGMEEMAAAADKTGNSFNDVDAGKVIAANKAIDEAKEVLSGAVTQLSIQFAPFIEYAAKKLAEFATQGKGLKGVMLDAFEAILTGLGKAADYLELVKSGWYMLKAAGLEAFAILETGIAKLLKGLEYLAEKLGKSHTGWGDSYAAEADKLEASAVEAFDKAGESYDKFMSGENAGKAQKWVAGIRNAATDAAAALEGAKPPLDGMAQGLNANLKALEAVTKQIEELEKKARQFKMSGAEKAADDASANGATPEQINQIKFLTDAIELMEQQKKLQEESGKDAQRIWDETRTPLEKYNAEIEKNQSLFAAGMLTADTLDRANQKAQDALDAATKTGESDHHEPAKLLGAGSADAASAIAAFTNGGRGGDAQEQLLKRQDLANGYLKSIADNAAKPPGFAVVNFN